ncbi:zinc knuckle [Fusarium albosuccineum]|uniref:Zinc knuckle n=1 Tax=Fusarium albosuccineum TaxID=1237068 RepID=A0A8H4PC26_9HYPO|nr:zinc knuckle [Fusarium albosuccineum]
MQNSPSISKYETPEDMTILIRKEAKDAKLPGSWRPLAMLCCVGKLLDKIVSIKLTPFVTAHKLLPETQFGRRCTSKALQYLFNIVYDAWVRGEVVTLLGLDMKGAYDNVVQLKLLQTLVRKGIPEWIVDYIHSFLIDRTTTLEMPGLVSDAFDLFMGIPQGSPLSPILFNLFTCPLLEEPKRDLYPGVTLYTFAFVDDTYVIAVSSSYQENCNAIEAFHAEILSAAEPLGILFGPEKYHVMHFKAPYKKLKGEKLDRLPNIPGLKRKDEPCQQMKVLGVIVHYMPRWQKHVESLKAKVKKRMNYLRRISGPTWGPSLSTMRMLYLTKIRPVITYACAAWFTLDPDSPNGPDFTWRITVQAISDLESLQRECLRQIAGAFMNTTGIVLEKELHIEIISVLLNRLATFHRAKELDSPECHQLRQMRTAHARHPFNWLEGPAAALYNDAENTKEWRLHQADPHSSVGNETKRMSIMRGLSKDDARERCSKKWTDYLKERPLRQERERNKPGNQGLLRHSPHVPQALIEPWGGESLKYYLKLSRAQSTMLLQCRTGFIGLKNHLCKINSAESPMCSCKRTYETVFHKLIQCSKLQEARDSLERQVGHTDFSRLLTTDGKVAAEWAITFFGIKQFDWCGQSSRFTSDDLNPQMGPP